MSTARTVAVVSVAWIVTISLLHAFLNWEFRPFAAAADRRPAVRTKIGFLPVTCHLTCPVAHFINTQQHGEAAFQPIKFSGWPELKEAYLSGHTQATFILAPMAMALREQGVPIKIVHLGHRDGTAMMVHKDSQIFRIEDLRGKRIAVPGRFSNQRLLVFRALKQHGIDMKDVTLLELPPPDMPAALLTRSVDAITSGEPFMGQTQLDGYGRVLYLTKDVWPNFISCVLAVSEAMIRDHRAEVRTLIEGIARSGKWLDSAPDHRMQAANFVAKNYYNQNPRLLEFVLSKPPDRVKYTNLTLHRRDFEEIEQLGKEAGILKGTAHFENYTDDSFTAELSNLRAYDFEARR